MILVVKKSLIATNATIWWYNCILIMFTLHFRDVPTKKHLKNVYSALALSMSAAAAGGAVHMFTQFLKVSLLHTTNNLAFPLRFQEVTLYHPL